MRLSKLKLTRNPHNINESLIKSKRKRNRHTLTKKKKREKRIPLIEERLHYHRFLPKDRTKHS